MKDLIVEKLAEIERTEDITILHAVESGTKPLSDSERIDITADMILRRYKEAFMELAK